MIFPNSRGGGGFDQSRENSRKFGTFSIGRLPLENTASLVDRWTNGVVPYKIKNTFNQNEIRTIKKAMEEMREENKNYSGKKLLIKNNPIGEGMTMKDLKDHLKTILSQIEVFRLCFFCLEPFPWTWEHFCLTFLNSARTCIKFIEAKDNQQKFLTIKENTQNQRFGKRIFHLKKDQFQKILWLRKSFS